MTCIEKSIKYYHVTRNCKDTVFYAFEHGLLIDWEGSIQFYGDFFISNHWGIMTMADRFAARKGLNEYVVIEINGKGITGEVWNDLTEEFTYRVNQESIDPRYLTIYSVKEMASKESPKVLVQH